MSAGPWLDPSPCGTEAAYRRHRRNGERADPSCLQAGRRAWHDKKRRRDDETCQAVLDILRRIDAGTGGDR